MARFWNRHKQKLVTVLLAFALAAVVAYYESTLLERTAENILRMISDGIFVSGICFLGIGLLLLIANAGGFDAFAYLVSNLRSVFSPRKNALSGRMTYMDYKLKKAAGREESGKPPVRVAVTGAVFVAMSVLLACAV
jgi:TM2 domain-containing membrane protein YozV